MKAFPVVTRELRVASRKWMTYWNRCIVGFGAIVVVAVALAIFEHGTPTKAGLLVFGWLAAIAYGHCLLTGLVLTADSLSEEKREGTLGLLFLTDLKGYDVVLGKLVASSLRGVYGLLAIVPVLGICLLLGGVTGAEFARVMLVCLNNLFLSMSLGMLASSFSKDERKAVTSAFLMLLLLTAAFPALGLWIYSRHQPPTAPFPWFMFVPSPGFSCFIAFDFLYKPQWFWPAVGLQHGLAWVALTVACVVAPRSWQDRARTAADERRRLNLTQWIYGSSVARIAFRRHLLEINPYHWLTSRDRLKRLLPWICIVAVAGIWAAGLWVAPSTWQAEFLYINTALILHATFKVLAAFEASRQLGGDRNSGALELLLCTPLDVKTILHGQWLSVAKQFTAPALLVCAGDVLFFLAGLSSGSGHQDTWVYTWFCGVTVFLADLVAITWLAMWLGLTHRHTGQGGISAIVRICLLPWLIFAGFMALMAVLEAFSVRILDRMENVLFALWWIVSMGLDAVFGIHAYRRLHNDLREVATARYAGRAAAWGRALGLLVKRAQKR